MVRLKHRYLLINILYPSPDLPSVTTTTTSSSSSQPAYLRFHKPTPSSLTQSFFLHAIRASITTLFGDCGLGLTSSSLKIVYFSHATSTIILRAPRSGVRVVWAGLTYLQEIRTGKERGGQEVKCVMRVVRVSGTIRKVQEEVVRRSRAEVIRARGMGDTIGLGGLRGGGMEGVRGIEDNEEAADLEERGEDGEDGEEV